MAPFLLDNFPLEEVVMALMSRLKVITEKDMDWIHGASLKILKETGVVYHNEDALKIFKKNGAKADGKLVYFPKSMVLKALESAPPTFKWRARNDSQSVTVGDQNEKLLLQPNGGPVFIQDLERGRKKGTLEDFANVIKICHASDIVKLIGSFPVDPSDVSPDDKHLHIMRETLRNTDKPVISQQSSSAKVKQLLDMVEITMGQNGFLDDHHCVGVGVDPLSPLTYDSAACETMIEFARRNQIIWITAAIMAGFSGPISLIGTITQQNAEILAGIILTQLVNPGNPVIYSNGSTVANMKSGNFLTGSPEMMLIQLAGMQMGLDYYHLPTRSMCGMTDSKIIDYQAGFETMQNLMVGILGGAHMIFECLGVLDAIMTTSYEKLIIDLEVISRVMRIREGLDLSEKENALKVIQEVGHDGTHITHPDTLHHFRQRWLPSLSDWNTYEDWQKAGSEDIAVRANKKYKEILAEAPERLIEPEVDKALADYIKRVI
jgi:trimethylamine--corrinoid protein Co-methyltransferase